MTTLKENLEKLDGYMSLFHGEKPQYHLYSTKTDELAYIVNSIKENLSKGLTYTEIAIATRLKDSLREIKSALHTSNLPYYDLTSQSGTMEGIQLSTFHSLKGLEFKVVFLADVNYRTAPFLPQSYNEFDNLKKEEYLLSERALIYVAITRAIQKVVITGTGSKSIIVQL
ncbi:MAG: ATP-binding domain-containing protein [Bacteroidales bacterium]|nr:ATP-binding domain-containing protein [Bacteroidales bacterium]